MKSNLLRIVFLLAAILFFGAARAGTVTYVYTDPQGTPLAEADANGNITATFDYRPYGTQALGAPKNGPGYTGHVNDADSGFVYMQARYYDPGVGRFLAVDPVVPEPGNIYRFNRYSYGNNNPAVNVDPDGRCVDADWGCGATARFMADHPEARKQMEPVAMYGAGAMLAASGAGVLVDVAGVAKIVRGIVQVAERRSGDSLVDILAKGGRQRRYKRQCAPNCQIA